MLCRLVDWPRSKKVPTKSALTLKKIFGVQRRSRLNLLARFADVAMQGHLLKVSSVALWSCRTFKNQPYTQMSNMVRSHNWGETFIIAIPLATWPSFTFATWRLLASTTRCFCPGVGAPVQSDLPVEQKNGRHENKHRVLLLGVCTVCVHCQCTAYSAKCAGHACLHMWDLHTSVA